jgi:Uma2 family endonuclease
MALAPAASKLADQVSQEWDDLPPLVLPLELRLTAEEFWQVCAANPKAVLERSADDLFIPMTPPGGDTGRRTARLLGSGRLEPPT